MLRLLFALPHNVSFLWINVIASDSYRFRNIETVIASDSCHFSHIMAVISSGNYRSGNIRIIIASDSYRTKKMIIRKKNKVVTF
jgi:hypothetical protein